MRNRDRTSPERTPHDRSRAADLPRTTTMTTTARSAVAASAMSTDGAPRRVDVTVMGMSLSVRTDREDAWLHGLARQVDRRVDELKRSAKNANPQQLAVLVAMNLAEELQTERQRSSGRERELEKKLETLASGALERVREALSVLGADDDEDDEVEDDEDDEDDSGR
jgi:cell division protein ZapA